MFVDIVQDGIVQDLLCLCVGLFVIWFVFGNGEGDEVCKCIDDWQLCIFWYGMCVFQQFVYIGICQIVERFVDVGVVGGYVLGFVQKWFQLVNWKVEGQCVECFYKIQLVGLCCVDDVELIGMGM